jgi:DNA-binding CsgD family transcriptional regulator
MTWRQMAQVLDISRTTIRGHLNKARDRLGAANTTHAVVLALSKGEIHLDTILEDDDDAKG